ncbi:MAG: terpene cyclase/mutase family protein [Phycisphaerae bacterium]|nr:terpene cyclase/mutase family protein [Phycisphaerae bacterium]
MTRVLARWLAVGWLAWLCLAVPGEEYAPATRSALDPFRKDETDRALEKAVAYLIRQQGEDGSIDKESRKRKPNAGIGRNSTALTSLAAMAIASLGHSPTDETPEGQALRKALVCVLDERRQRKDGYFGEGDHSRMYGHGIASLLLAEMLGMGVDREQDRQIRARLLLAIELILRSQNVRKEPRFRGGWRYEPDSSDSDLSVTVWQVMALRSARNAGIIVPKEAVDLAADYIRRSYRALSPRADARAVAPASFGYQPGGGDHKYAMGAAGLLSLQVCGFYEDPTVKGSADWLMEFKPTWETEWFLYGTYYYAQGMYQRGDKYAEHAREVVQSILLRHQENNGEHAGSWDARQGEERDAGRVYATSMAILSLSVKYHYLPIYQR